jgi:hypothetical protein
MALTVFIAGVRLRKPVENNWPFFYWVLVGVLALTNSDLFDLRIISVGVISGLLLRFEFMSRGVSKLIMTVEMAVWVYILYACWATVISY